MQRGRGAGRRGGGALAVFTVRLKALNTCRLTLINFELGEL
jgi:hypothetical protein